jgi:hypothetical protein
MAATAEVVVAVVVIRFGFPSNHVVILITGLNKYFLQIYTKLSRWSAILLVPPITATITAAFVAIFRIFVARVFIKKSCFDSASKPQFQFRIALLHKSQLSKIIYTLRKLRPSEPRYRH